jgi:hypothetical protein
VTLPQANFRLSPFLPQNEHDQRLLLLRLVLGITFLTGLLAVIDQRQYADEIAVWAVSPRWRWALRLWGLLLGTLGLLLVSTWTSLRSKWFDLIELAGKFTNRMGVFTIIVASLLSLVFPLLILGQYGRFVMPFFTRLFIFWILTVTATWLVTHFRSGDNPIHVFIAIALIYGVIHRLAVFRADLYTYPFSLGWSEASRYYYASLFLAKRIYGLAVPPSILHPTRYLMQSLPLLIPGTAIIVHRTWQVLIWVILAALTGKTLVNRLNVKGYKIQILIVLWTFLFLFQGPVYYHLLVIVILILWGTNSSRPLITLSIVAITSIWAGISRINWIPVPGMLAGLIYLLEQSNGKKGLTDYFLWPVIWFVVGSVVGLLSQTLYIPISGNELTSFGSSFYSQLLWYRLLPSGTYALGVLPAIFFASLPLLILILNNLRREGQKIATIRNLSVYLILAVLFFGGILVSVKIGGGSNLHNMDAFLVALLFAGIYSATGHWRWDNPRTEPNKANQFHYILLVTLMPVFFAIGLGKPLRVFDHNQAKIALTKIQSIIDEVAERDGEVLFISQRHLLTLGQIKDVELIPEYETVFLMEMAMSRNRPYLDRFHADLESHNFDLIIVDSLSTQIQNRDHNFAEENNAWVEEISYPILCHYELIDSLSEPPLQFFVPSPENKSCSY